MYQDRYSYPAFFYYDEDGISIEFPDLPGCLPCAPTSAEAFRNAREALGLHLYGMETDNEHIPTPSDPAALRPEDGGVIAMIEVFMPPVRDRLNNRAIKKTLTIPAWLSREAEAAGINFSQALQDGIRQQLGL